MNLIDKYLGENELRDKAISVKQRDFKKMGLSFDSKWDNFIKKNKIIIDKEVETIKKNTSIIADKKRRDKKFKDEMRIFKNKLTDLWSAMK